MRESEKILTTDSTHPKPSAADSSPQEALRKAISDIPARKLKDLEKDSAVHAKPTRKPAARKRTKRATDISFKTSASGRPAADGRTMLEFEKKNNLAREIFAPGTPVLSKEHLAGRLGELERIISSIEDKRDHVVVYGPRGWGKSSIVNTVAQIAHEAGYIVVKASCGAYASYSQMFRSFLSEIPLLYDRDAVLKRPATKLNAEFDQLLPDGDFTAKELTDIMERLTTTRIVMILDEYDRIRNKEFKLAITETIKNFSDRSIRAQLLIVGVADALNQLIGLNPSIRRNISGIELKLLENKEVMQLMRIGEEVTGISFEPAAKDRIIHFSRRTPYNVKLLLLYASQKALSHSRTVVSEQDVLNAARRAAVECEVLVQDKVVELLSESGNESRRTLLYAVAEAAINRLDESGISEIVEVHNRLTGETTSPLSIGRRLAHLTKGSEPILSSHKKAGKIYYSFTDSMTAFYLRLMHGLNSQ